MVAALKVIIPDDAGGLWKALKDSAEVESALGVLIEPNPADHKYLKSLAETYQNSVSWDTDDKFSLSWPPYSLLQ